MADTNEMKAYNNLICYQTNPNDDKILFHDL